METRTAVRQRVNAHRGKRNARALALPSAVTHGRRPTDLLPGVRYSSRWGRHYLRTQRELLADRGGADSCSAAQVILARHAAAVETELYLRLVRLSHDGTGADDKILAAYQTSLNTLRRALEDLGLQRTPRELPSTGEVVEGDATVIDVPPDPIRREVEKRAFQGSDSLLATLFRANESKREDEADEPQGRVFEVTK